MKLLNQADSRTPGKLDNQTTGQAVIKRIQIRIRIRCICKFLTDQT